MPLLLGLACLTCFAALASALGLRLLRWLRLENLNEFETVVLATGLGIGALQAVPVILFATGIGRPTAFRIVFATLGILLIPDLIRFARALGGVCRAVRRSSWWERTIAVIVLALMAAIFLRTVCPPVDGDALSYHLAAAKRFLQAGRFVFLPSVTHSNWPLGIELLYAALQAVDSSAPVAIVQFLLGCVTLGAVWLLARQIGGRFAAAVAVVLLLLDNGIWQEMTMAYVDLGTTAFATLAVYSFARALRVADGSPPCLTSAAIFTGLAATTKLNGMWVIVALTIVVLTTGGDDFRRRAARAARFGVIAAVVVSPWFIRTWVLTGNPLYPAFFGVFGGREWTAAGFARLHEFYLRLNVIPGVPTTQAVLQGSHAALAAVGIGIAVVVCRLNTHSEVDIPARFAASFFALMCTFSILNLRFMMALLPATVICVACRFRRAEGIAGAVLVIAAAVLALRLGAWKLDPNLRTAIAVATGTKSTADYQREGVLDYDVVQFANKSLPVNARIAVSELAVDAALYDRQTFWTDYWMQDSFHYDSQDRLAQDFRRLGITHLVVQTTYPPWCDASHACFNRNNVERTMLLDLARKRGTLLFLTDRIALFEISP